MTAQTPGARAQTADESFGPDGTFSSRPLDSVTPRALSPPSQSARTGGRTDSPGLSPRPMTAGAGMYAAQFIGKLGMSSRSPAAAALANVEGREGRVGKDARPASAASALTQGSSVQRRQLELFTQLQHTVRSLQHDKVTMAGRVELLEHESRSLRTGSVYPQTVIDQLESKIQSIEEVSARRVAHIAQLEKLNFEYDCEIGRLQTSLAGVQESAEEAIAASAAYEAQMLALQTQNISGMYEISTEDQKLVDTAIDDVLADDLFASPPGSPSPSAQSERNPSPPLEGDHGGEAADGVEERALEAARFASMLAAQRGASLVVATVEAEAAAKAVRSQREDIIAHAEVCRQEVLPFAEEPRAAVLAAEAAISMAWAEGSDEEKPMVMAAGRAAMAAMATGACTSGEAAIAGKAAARAFAQVGATYAHAAGNAALIAVRRGAAEDTALTAAIALACHYHDHDQEQHISRGSAESGPFDTGAIVAAAQLAASGCTLGELTPSRVRHALARTHAAAEAAPATSASSDNTMANRINEAVDVAISGLELSEHADAAAEAAADAAMSALSMPRPSFLHPAGSAKAAISSDHHLAWANAAAMAAAAAAARAAVQGRGPAEAAVVGAAAAAARESIEVAAHLRRNAARLHAVQTTGSTVHASDTVSRFGLAAKAALSMSPNVNPSRRGVVELGGIAAHVDAQAVAADAAVKVRHGGGTAFEALRAAEAAARVALIIPHGKAQLTALDGATIEVTPEERHSLILTAARAAADAAKQSSVLLVASAAADAVTVAWLARHSIHAAKAAGAAAATAMMDALAERTRERVVAAKSEATGDPASLDEVLGDGEGSNVEGGSHGGEATSHANRDGSVEDEATLPTHPEADAEWCEKAIASVAEAAAAAAVVAEGIVRAALEVTNASSLDGDHGAQVALAAAAKGVSTNVAPVMVLGETVETAAAVVWAATTAAATPELQALETLGSAVLASAMVASQSASEGATAEMVASSAKHAAASIAGGASLEEVQEAARQAAPQVPGWSLETWLGGLPFDKLVSDAILKRIRSKVPDGKDLQAFEQAFIVKLGELSSSETILALLKETPLLQQVADEIYTSAKQLGTELGEARAMEKAMEEAAAAEEAEQRAREQAIADDEAAAAAEEASLSPMQRKWRRAKKETLKAGGGKVSISDVSDDVEAMNAKFVKSGAFTLSFSTDSSVYWGGLQRVIGPPKGGMPIIDAMEHEHCKEVDSELLFEVSNYQTFTTSHIEFLFVTQPTDGLQVLNLDEWPGTESYRPEHDRRDALTYDDFQAHWKKINVNLRCVNEQPLSIPEFAALRLYTGPLYVKYNGILRAALSGVPFLEQACQKLCMGNQYPTTLHVLTTAIIKLGKLEKAQLVYRAPGGALPASFWRRNPEGVQGGLEIAFMSTTTAKEEAMAYARRAPGMILFEIQQGIVARGASISWLSQHPHEEEILFPPLTALEVVGSRIDGAVVVVQLRASMKAPGLLKTGGDDLDAAEQERADFKAQIAKQRFEIQLCKSQAKQMEARFIEKARYRRTAHEMQLAVTRQQALAARRKGAEDNFKRVKLLLDNEKNAEARKGIEQDLLMATKMCEVAAEAQKKAEVRADELAENERHAQARIVDLGQLLKKAETNSKGDEELRARYSKLQFAAGAQRAQRVRAYKLAEIAREGEAAALEAARRAEQEKEEALAEAAEALEAAESGGKSGGKSEPELTVEIVEKLRASIGPRESWKTGSAAEIVQKQDASTKLLDHLIYLCDTSGKGSKNRKAARDAGVFDDLQLALYKYEEVLPLQLRCMRVIDALCRKAEKEDMQEAGATVIWPLATAMRNFHFAGPDELDELATPGVNAFRALTRNHRNNTTKCARSGGLLGWLSDDSNVLAPDEMTTEYEPTKEEVERSAGTSPSRRKSVTAAPKLDRSRQSAKF